MARLLPIVLTAIFASIVAADLESCGSADYDPAQYTCYDGTLLCPIVNGDKYLACGNDCYSATKYTCFNGDFLCPFVNGTATQACGDACYNPFKYSCANGQLTPLPSCIGDFGVNEICTNQGCFLLPCCPGLISVADHCRDPCQLVPGSCPMSAS
ncbi:carbohydrate binding-domain-containing protein [Mycena metata]|uniref:Carbohydrate binding-domain-containing protein n=1 Tax=Mycena metata TaxID=1033252 RepID=A0AAD7NM35_9AGAR|nr:carbohydrate binding-domain-containing protein [Mycena metata]